MNNQNNNLHIKTINVENLFGHVSYSLEFKEQVSFLYGSNGIGKTTLFRAIDKDTNVTFLKDKTRITIINKDDVALCINKKDTSDYPKIKYIPTITNYYSNAGKGDLSDVQKKMQDMLNKIKQNIILTLLLRHILKYMSQTRLKKEPNKELLRDNADKWLGKQDLPRELGKKVFDEFINILDAYDIKDLREKFNERIEEADKNIGNMYISLENPVNPIVGLTNSIIDKHFREFIKEFINYHKNTIDNAISCYKEKGDSGVSDATLLKFVKKIVHLEKAFNKFYDGEPKQKELRFKDEKFDISVDGQQVTIDNFSSGELNIFYILLNIVFESENYKVMLIDEPEISLHLRWQEKFADIINSLIKELDIETQIIFATHSIFIAGDDDSIVRTKDFKYE